MKFSVSAVAAALLAANVAAADQTEIVVLGSATQDDSEHALLSFRHALKGSLEDGVYLRLDGSVSEFRFLNGGTPTEGNQAVLRAAIGYSMPLGGGYASLFGGISNVSRTFSPASVFLTPVDETGFFVGAEYNEWEDDDAGWQALVEYESGHEALYTRLTYLFDYGQFSVGPTLNYLDEGDYSRTAGGIWVNYRIDEQSSLFGSLVAAEGGNDGAPKRASGYVEFGAKLEF